MSTILKALRRLEEDRNLQAQGDLRDAVVAPMGGPTPVRDRRWLVAGLLFTTLGVVAVLYAAPWSADVPPAGTPELPALSERSAPPAPVGMAAQRQRSRSVAAALPASESVAAASAPDIARRSREPAPSEVPTSSVQTASVLPRVSVLEAEPDVRPTPASEPAARLDSPPASRPRPSPARPTKQPPAAEPTTAPRESAATVVKAIVPRRAVPDMRVTRTVWHPQSERRMAVVQMGEGRAPLELREGRGRDASLVLMEIEPAGVVFVHDGIQIRRRIGKP